MTVTPRNIGWEVWTKGVQLYVRHRGGQGDYQGTAISPKAFAGRQTHEQNTVNTGQ